MIQKILVGTLATLAFVGLGLVAIFMMQPSEVVVERSVVVDASPEDIFAHVDDFRAWEQWSSLAGPDRELSFEGADRGEGAVLEWEGDEEVGTGRMTIVDSRPGESLEIEVELRQAVHSWHTVLFGFEAVDDGTRVTWSTRTEMSAPTKIFMSDDSIEETMGADFDEKLARLAAVVEDGER